MKLNFTSRAIEAIKAPIDTIQVDYWDEKFPMFGLRASKLGRKSWVVLYRFNGRLRRLTLGTYPELSLADARDKAKLALHDVQMGVDPATKKANDRRAETVRDLNDDYILRHAMPRKKSWREDQRILNKEVLPYWGNWKAKDVTRKDVLRLLDKTIERGATVHANRVLALVRKMYNFGIHRGIVDLNPCYAIPRPTKEQARDRVLTADEVRIIWAILESESLLVGSIFKMQVVLIQRGYETRSMERSELDLESGFWNIPATKTKNKLAHRVPLSSFAKKILEKVLASHDHPRWVFPSPFVPAKHIDNLQKAIQRIRREAKVDCVAHDFRRTGASHMTSMGIHRSTVGKILNHVEPGVTKVYDRHSYDDEKRVALERWGQRLQEILHGGETLLLRGRQTGVVELNLPEKNEEEALRQL